MIEAIVLAAGLGRRMGSTKPLIEIDGQPALGVILQRLHEAGIPGPIVVLGHSAELIQDTVDLGNANVVVNRRPEEGMSQSLALGLEAVSEEAVGAMILHADMPFVETSTIRLLIEAAENGARMAAPTFRGRRGFPVYFARACFAELQATLDGDTGARAYLTQHASDLVLIEVDTDGCLRDIDTPGDLARAKETLHALHADR